MAERRSSCCSWRLPCVCCSDSSAESKQSVSNSRLLLSQKISFASGHVLNDLAGGAWFSYLLVFLTKVGGLSNSHAGYILLTSQVFESLCTPVAGILCDRTVSRYGRRKTWHIMGTICVTISLPFIFTRCIGCEGSPSTTKLIYYIGFAMVFGFGWGAAQIGHLALIPEICHTESEAIELCAWRSAMTFLCGIFVYGVTWILLGQSKDESLSPNVWKQFMYLGFIVVGTGTIFNVIFHAWTEEPPSEALLEWKEKQRMKKMLNGESPKNESESKALLKVSCQSPDGLKRGAAPPVATTIYGGSAEDLLLLRMPDKPRDKEQTFEIIDRSAVKGEERRWSQWLKYPVFYKIGLVYTCSRLVVNVSQSYFPLYLIETLKFEKEAIAYLPLVVLVSGVVASTSVKSLIKRLGSQISFALGSLMALGACIWFFVQTIEGRNAVYATAILMGCGGSVMLVTSLSLIAELIGDDKESGAFVYGVISFTDKLSSGVIIAIIQEMNPRTGDYKSDCPSCDQYVRHVISLAPGSAALVALVSVILFFDSIFTCRRKVQQTEATTQTEKTDARCKMKRRHLEHDDELDIGNSDHNGSINKDRPSLATSEQFDQSTLITREGLNQGTCKESEELDQREMKDSGVLDYIQPPIDTNLFETRNFLKPHSCMVENYAAMRLASPFIPSPQIERRTIV